MSLNGYIEEETRPGEITGDHLCQVADHQWVLLRCRICTILPEDIRESDHDMLGFQHMHIHTYRRRLSDSGMSDRSV